VVDPLANGDRVRILVAEDDDLGRRLIERVLAVLEYDVTLVSDGVAAMAAFEREHFDVVVADVIMPTMDGIALLRAIRDRDIDVPVVLLTGAPDMASALAAIELGAFGYLPKPFDISHLRAILERAVSSSKRVRLRRASMQPLDNPHQQTGGRIGLDVAFERAIDSMWMAYQPIVRVRDHGLFGYEALMRSSEITLPNPGAVLDAAEKLGRIFDLGKQVRSRAAESIDDAQDTVSLCVNLHATDLGDDNLLASTEPLSKLAPRVVLEITEHANLEGVDDVRGRLRTLREMGFRIAVDDLGAGHDGLTSFTVLQPDVVKLDMDLVRDVDTSRTKRSIVTSMVTLCHDMGVMVVAEGVETSAERDALVDLGCDLLQGYLFAKPGPAFPAFTWTT
jgi:EAL domain-containing protein (putative c-di-GMP-specific phosphodiesterase class I)/CheY-like chemotaxis protein